MTENSNSICPSCGVTDKAIFAGCANDWHSKGMKIVPDYPGTTELNLNGSALTLTAVAAIANMIDTHGGCVVKCGAKAYHPGATALMLGMEIERRGKRLARSMKFVSHTPRVKRAPA